MGTIQPECVKPAAVADGAAALDGDAGPTGRLPPTQERVDEAPHAPPRFTEVHLAYLRERAIDPELAWREGVRSLDEAEVRRVAHNQKVRGDGLAFAYADVEVAYTRVQLDARERNGKKTVSPPGVTPPPYVVSTTTEDLNEPLFIVEAPAKALSLASNGFTDVIGCGGVNAGVFEKGTSRLQPLMARYAKAPRTVVIVFDAGRATNPQVAKAEARIARALMDHGCTVRVVELPLGPDGSDQGPDDFLAGEGREAFRSLVDAAKPAEPAEWAKTAAEAGPAEARALVEHLPFVAALVAGGPAAMDGATESLRAYHSRSGLLEACRGFKAALAEKAKADMSARAAAVRNETELERGDEVEVALLHLKKLGSPVVFAENETHVYADGIWSKLEREHQVAAVMDFAGMMVVGSGEPKPLKLDSRACRGAVHLSQCKTLDARFFDQATAGLVFANGFLREAEGRLALEPWSEEHRARFAYAFAYEPGAPCPEWDRYLSTVWEGDPDADAKTAVLQEFVGACLFGAAPRYKTALILHGDADSGKSTCLDVVRGVFPTNTVTSVSMHEFEQEYRRAKLAGKLLNTVAEVPSGELVKSEAFKAIIAGDTIEGRAIRQAPFDFRPLAGHLFAANTLPRINDRSEAVWARWVLLTFNQRFARRADVEGKRAKVEYAKRILETEVPGIIAWAARGFERLLANGRYTDPPSSGAALQAWRRESDPVELFFEDEVELKAGATITSELAFSRYRAWCVNNGFSKPLAHPSFARAFATLLRRITRTKEVTKKVHGYTVFVDVRFRQHDPHLKLVDYGTVFS
jgi:P4 family phage/plasmid primase-like protien